MASREKLSGSRLLPIRVSKKPANRPLRSPAGEWLKISRCASAEPCEKPQSRSPAAAQRRSAGGTSG